MTQSVKRTKAGTPSRRQFLQKSAVGAIALAAPTGALASKKRLPDVVSRYLADRVVPRETIDRFLDPNARVWARFHPTYGYLLRDAFLRDGVDGARTFGSYEAGGPRKQVNFADQPCRINTYGDSFTQGHQVSDGETWQEVLAAHFCEPIRNYGIGGFGVHQACLRMRDNESTDNGASHVILNIWGDDHHRSIYACRWLSFPTDFLPAMTGVMFHANPWAHVRLNPNGQGLEEHPSACPTPESLYNMCDADWMIEQFGADDVTHALVAANTGEVGDAEPLERLGNAGGFEDLNWSDNTTTRLTAQHLLNHYAVTAGMLVVEQAQRRLADAGKRLFVLLSHPSGSVKRHCEGKRAEDIGAIDWHPRRFMTRMQKIGVPCLDSVEAHVEDFARFRGTAQEYIESYYIGHYTPTGNHFFAFEAKDRLIEWLNPAPPAYAGAGDETLIRFQGYLPE